MWVQKSRRALPKTWSSWKEMPSVSYIIPLACADYGCLQDKAFSVVYVYHSFFLLGVRRNHNPLCYKFSRSGRGVEPFRLAIRSLGRSSLLRPRSYLHLHTYV